MYTHLLSGRLGRLIKSIYLCGWWLGASVGCCAATYYSLYDLLGALFKIKMAITWTFTAAALRKYIFIFPVISLHQIPINRQLLATKCITDTNHTGRTIIICTEFLCCEVDEVTVNRYTLTGYKRKKKGVSTTGTSLHSELRTTVLTDVRHRNNEQQRWI